MTDEPAVRAGVVGVGRMGSHHARVYRELPAVELVGVADRDQGRAGGVAADCHTRAYEPAALLDEVDVVSVAVPTQHHCEVARVAVSRGVDVLVEKPLAREPGAARELVRRADDRDVVLQVGHVERFNPAVSALADIVPEVDVVAAEARRLGPPVDRELGEGVAVDLMIHDIDLLRWLVDGPLEVIDAIGAADGRYVAAQLRAGDGVVATLAASRVTQKRVRELSLTARGCQVTVDYIEQSVRVHRHAAPEYVADEDNVRYRNESVIERPMVEGGEPLARELSAFVEAARSGDEPPVSGEDGLRALELALEVDALTAVDRERAPEVNLS